MIRFTPALVGLVLLGSPSGQEPQPLLVSADWVAQQVSDPHLRIFHIGPRGSYDKGHIPGTQYLSLREISTNRDGLSLEMLAADELEEALRGKGVSNDSRIVFYWSDEWVTAASRAFLTFEYAGLGGHLSILNGGLDAWRASGHPTTLDQPVVTRGTMTIRIQPNIIAAADWIDEHRNDTDITVVDARLPEFHNGSRKVNMPRQGRIPGAQNIPFNTLTTDSLRLLPLEAIRAVFEKAGVRPGGRVVTYCHIGQQATWVYFVAKVLGYKASLYDGSFQEWSATARFPVEGPAPAPQGGTL